MTIVRRTPWTSTPATAAAGLVLLAACGAEVPAQTEVTREVVDLPGADRPLDLHVEEVYRLGGAAARGWQAFGRIRSLSFDGRGLLHVFDQGASAVRVVGTDGALVRSVGRKGDGPGELSAPTGMAVAPDGTLLVWDLGRRSLAVFAPDGTYRRNARPDDSRGRIGAFAADGQGRIVGLPLLGYVGHAGSGTLEVEIPTDGGTIEDPPGLPLLRVDLGGDRAEVLRWNWLPVRESDGGRPRETAFLPAVRWALLPDGRVAVADSMDYRVHLVGDSVEVVMRRPFAPRAVTASDRRAELERRAADGGGGGGAVGGGVAGIGRTPEEAEADMQRQRRAQLARTLAFYPELQAVQGLKADPAGRIWVERVGDSPGEPGPVDVLTAAGGYLGTVPAGSFTLPDAFGPGGLAVWLSSDEVDVPVVTVRRVSLVAS